MLVMFDKCKRWWKNNKRLVVPAAANGAWASDEMTAG